MMKRPGHELQKRQAVFSACAWLRCDKSDKGTAANVYRSRSSLDDITSYSASTDKANTGAGRKRSSSSSSSGVWLQRSPPETRPSLHTCLGAGSPKQAADETRARFALSRGHLASCSNRSATSSPFTQDSIMVLLASLRQIQAELEYFTRRLESKDESESARNDWKFASAVIDRLCLIVFGVFIILTTCGVLFSAPHLVA